MIDQLLANQNLEPELAYVTAPPNANVYGIDSDRNVILVFTNDTSVTTGNYVWSYAEFDTLAQAMSHAKDELTYEEDKVVLL